MVCARVVLILIYILHLRILELNKFNTFFIQILKNPLISRYLAIYLAYWLKFLPLFFKFFS